VTSKHAERITGLRVQCLPQPQNAYALYSDGANGPLHTATSHSPSQALEMLVKWHYDQMRLQVFVEQHWRCWHCWGLKALSCDHIKPRAHGRVDQRFNLRGMCAECHERHTRNEALEIHPKMKTLMSGVGYRWRGEWGLGVEAWGWEKLDVG
jgi:hypothetical protein